ncbi:hypothetical protein B9Z55_017392 [Caenorhabditis nigoni]|uniref:G-protein coupled receptors family 1 profile domain-containing protein n=1 Tax=Caenorhabditis nigoni TaxID=1611254 RepID=A0A2G5T8Y2_9PELO|nr:hypothetical protein B9Z55_017392 [Caenorhabditis nigoni]
MHYSENSIIFPPPPQSHESVQCGPQLDPDECETSFESGLNYFSFPILGQNLICFVNFVFQILAIWMVYRKKKFQQGSFYFLLITLAISVLLRTIIFIITLIFATFADDTLSYSIPTTISLYTDAISENFSIVLIFFISLNRCLIIVKNQWNDAIFEGKRVIVPIIISISISVLGAYLSIRTSKITRKYDSDMGFIDFGEPNGFKKLIARLFYIFPLASAICYLIIFIYLKKRKKILLSQNNSNNKGQQNVFIQILITVFFYGVLQKVLEPQMLFSMLSDNVSNFRILGIH